MSSKRFPFTKRSLDSIPAHDPKSPSRESEYSDAECIGLKLRVSKELYLPHAIQHKKTWKEDPYKLDRQIIPAFGDFRISSITARDISTFLTQQKKRSASGAGGRWFESSHPDQCLHENDLPGIALSFCAPGRGFFPEPLRGVSL